MADYDEAFWKSVDNNRMEIPFCRSCDQFFFYPRPFCPNCWSKDIERRPISGKGSVWSYSIVHFPHGPNEGWKSRVPYIVALVTLAENVRLMSNIVDCAIDDVLTGMDVEVSYRPFDGRTLPTFIPV
jgi:uncharacterized OB-fold protein